MCNISKISIHKWVTDVNSNAFNKPHRGTPYHLFLMNNQYFKIITKAFFSDIISRFELYTYSTLIHKCCIKVA